MFIEKKKKKCIHLYSLNCWIKVYYCLWSIVSIRLITLGVLQARVFHTVFISFFHFYYFLSICRLYFLYIKFIWIYWLMLDKKKKKKKCNKIVYHSSGTLTFYWSLSPSHHFFLLQFILFYFIYSLLLFT